MKLKVINIEGKNVGDIEISDKIFLLKPNNDIIQSLIDWQLNHFKPRTAKTKQRSEITGSTAKIYAQKGTGGARHSSRKAPLFVGGGVAHGPKGQLAYKKRKLNKSEKKLSITSLISEKNKLNNLFVFSDFKNQILKTKEMNAILNKFELNNTLIILDKSSKENIYKSVRNIPNIKVTDVNHFSAFDIIKFKKVVFTESSVKELEKRYS